jgi:hypothetical protein
VTACSWWTLPHERRLLDPDSAEHVRPVGVRIGLPAYSWSKIKGGRAAPIRAALRCENSKSESDWRHMRRLLARRCHAAVAAASPSDPSSAAGLAGPNRYVQSTSRYPRTPERGRWCAARWPKSAALAQSEHRVTVVPVSFEQRSADLRRIDADHSTVAEPSRSSSSKAPARRSLRVPLALCQDLNPPAKSDEFPSQQRIRRGDSRGTDRPLGVSDGCGRQLSCFLGAEPALQSRLAGLLVPNALDG